MTLKPLFTLALIAPLAGGCSVDLTPLTPLIERAAAAYDSGTLPTAPTAGDGTSGLVTEDAAMPADGDTAYGPGREGDRPQMANGGMDRPQAPGFRGGDMPAPRGERDQDAPPPRRR